MLPPGDIPPNPRLWLESRVVKTKERVPNEPEHLTWIKAPLNRWARLLDLDLESVRAHGVYVIWHGGYPTRVVKIGHGDLAAGLAACRKDARVTGYAKEGPLFVTWAAADASHAAGIARHLEGILRPLLEDHAGANVVAIAANSPF